MSIFPPTDIVSEVAQAADPDKLRKAVARLGAVSATGAPADDRFSVLMAGFRSVRQKSGPESSAAETIGPSPSSTRVGSVSVASGEASRPPDATRKFEAYIVQSCLETILPKEDRGYFGRGVGGGIWRSMMAEQLATQIVKAGGIGLHQLFERTWSGQASAEKLQPEMLQAGRQT